MRLLLLPLVLAAAGCTFQGSGLAPFTPAPASPSESDLEVPYVPTPRPVVAAMLDMAELSASDYLIDLGSGDGRIPIMAAQRGARALGVEIDPIRIDEAVRAARTAGVEMRAGFRRQDLFMTPLREADVVALYLMPELNLRLRPRLLTELRPGARIVSHNFHMGDWRADEEREVEGSRLFLWIVPAAAEGRWLIETDTGRTHLLELEQRFQEVAGTIDGQPLQNVRLRGRDLDFTADLGDGPRPFAAQVGDAEIVVSPGAERPSWRARRIG